MTHPSELKAKQPRSSEIAFTLVETMVGVAVVGLLVIVLLTSIAHAISITNLNSQNLRATEILTEKMELIRVCTWAQITNGYTSIPNTFTATHYNPGSTNTASGSFTYQGTINIAAAPIAEYYSTNLRQITITVTWTNNNLRRARSMTTFVSPYGIQPYVF